MSGVDLSGRVALVTGGARGLGQGMASGLAEAGADVMIADVLEDVGRAAELGTAAKSGFVRLDVTDDASWEAAVAATVSQLGGLDIVVNNAGLTFSGVVAVGYGHKR